jgi:hypothetical protein
MGVRGASRDLGGIFAMAVFAAFIDFFLKLGSYDRPSLLCMCMHAACDAEITLWS